MAENGKKEITLMSFGFKHGQPDRANLLFDVRFLQNPYWVPELKDKTGRDEDVGAYIREDPAFEQLIGDIEKFVEFVTPLYPDDHDREFVVAIGCTGGRHRSVHTVETLFKRFQEKDITVRAHHRDLKE